MAMLNQGLQLGLVTGHTQEPGQLLHHGHQVLEDKDREQSSHQRQHPGHRVQLETVLNGLLPQHSAQNLQGLDLNSWLWEEEGGVGIQGKGLESCGSFINSKEYASLA